MSNLEELKKDMEQKRKTANAAYDAYAAYAAYDAEAAAYDAYYDAGKKYEEALKKAPATADVTISRECAQECIKFMCWYDADDEERNPAASKAFDELKAALEKNDE